MGIKSRFTHGTGGWCNKRDCANRDTIKCNECFYFKGEMTGYVKRETNNIQYRDGSLVS